MDFLRSKEQGEIGEFYNMAGVIIKRSRGGDVGSSVPSPGPYRLASTRG